MSRKPGRPRTAMIAMDAALFGQLRSVVMDMDERGVPWPPAPRVRLSAPRPPRGGRSGRHRCRRDAGATGGGALCFLSR
jgi:hypothetical protein